MRDINKLNNEINSLRRSLNRELKTKDILLDVIEAYKNQIEQLRQILAQYEQKIKDLQEKKEVVER